MGMFDSFYLIVECPYCKNIDMVEFQTKEFDCRLNNWKQGDEFNGSGMETGTIYGLIGGCNSKECDSWQVKEDGYKSGFGRTFYCDVYIKDKVVVKAINVREER